MPRRAHQIANRIRTALTTPTNAELDAAYLAGFRAGRRLNELDNERLTRGARPGQVDTANR